MRYHLSACLAMYLVWPALAQPPAPDAARFKAVAQALADAYNADDAAAFRHDFAPVMLDAVSLDAVRSLFADTRGGLGRLTALDDGRADVLYPRTVVFPAYFERGALDVKIVLDRDGKIAGLWFLPHLPPIPVPERNETPLALPFRGEGFIGWGGDDKAHNAHHDVPNQRFAVDFLAADAKGSTHRGQGMANEDYYCWGREILAPADGVVTDVITGVRDNSPGSMNPFSATGNTVVLRHREHEFSLMAHLKLGSLRVKVGDRVKAGDVLGLCGNSGNSSEPHLHYHLQNTPVIQDATCIHFSFRGVRFTRDGKTEDTDTYFPLKSDRVTPR